jgi:hypothetical protein
MRLFIGSSLDAILGRSLVRRGIDRRFRVVGRSLVIRGRFRLFVSFVDFDRSPQELSGFGGLRADRVHPGMSRQGFAGSKGTRSSRFVSAG